MSQVLSQEEVDSLLRDITGDHDDFAPPETKKDMDFSSINGMDDIDWSDVKDELQANRDMLKNQGLSFCVARYRTALRELESAKSMLIEAINNNTK